jgi:hypothetical protein
MSFVVSAVYFVGISVYFESFSAKSFMVLLFAEMQCSEFFKILTRSTIKGLAAAVVNVNVSCTMFGMR